MECYNCRKEEILEERLLLSKERQTRQGKRKEARDDNKGKSNVKIEEINAIIEDEDGDILFNSSLEKSQLVTTADQNVQDWVKDSRVSFQVTPHREWFTNYDAKRTSQV